MAVSEMKYVGVDGCKGGWLCVGLNDDNDYYEVKGFWEFSDLLDYYKDACLILVDMPIGLPSPGPEARTCDKVARKKLVGRSSSVFRVPIREVVQRAADGETREKVNALSESCNSKGIGAQTFGIVRKIAEVDEVMVGAKRPVNVREAHPEVCFWAFNGKVAMSHPKRKDGKVWAQGIKERINVLKAKYPQSPRIYSSAKIKFLVKRNLVTKDDIIDALALAVTAKLGCRDNQYMLQTLPANPCKDNHGLPMEMVYLAKTNKTKAHPC